MDEKERRREKERRAIKMGWFFTFFFAGIAILFLILNLLGIVQEVGIVVGLIGMLISLLFGTASATRGSVGRIEKGIAKSGDGN